MEVEGHSKIGYYHVVVFGTVDSCCRPSAVVVAGDLSKASTIIEESYITTKYDYIYYSDVIPSTMAGKLYDAIKDPSY